MKNDDTVPYRNLPYRNTLKVCHDIAWLLRNETMKKLVCGKLGDAYLKIRRLLWNNRALEKSKQSNDLKWEGDVHGNIGDVHRLRGEYHDAMECYKKALDICQQTGDLEGKGKAHHGIGIVHKSRGLYHDAMECLKKALDIYQQTGDLTREGRVHHSIGDVHYSRDEYHDAMECYKKALDIRQQTGDLAGEGKAHHGIGIVHELRDEYHDAMECYKKALDIFQQTGDLAGEGCVHFGIGNVHYSRDEYHDAMECYKKALDIFQQTGKLEGEGRVRSNLGCVCIMLHELNNAELYLRKSLGCFEKIFSNLSQNDQWKVYIVDTYIKTYQMLTCILAKVGKTEDALLVSERGRSLALRDKLLEKYEMVPNTVVPITTYQHAASLISNYDSTFVTFFLPHKEYPSLYSFTLSRAKNVCLRVLSLDAIGRILRDCQATDLDIILDSCVSKIVEDAKKHLEGNPENTFEDRSLPEDDNNACRNVEVLQDKKRDKLLEDVFRLLDSSLKRDNPSALSEEDDDSTEYNKENNDDAFSDDSNLPVDHDDVSSSDRTTDTRPNKTGEDLLKDLYQVLIAPVEDELIKPEIVIIPDGPLFFVPFAALQSPAGHFLSDTKRIRIGPSLTTLKLLKDYPLEKQSKTGALIVGGPVAVNVMFRGKPNDHFDLLPYAWREAEAIKKILGVKPLIGISATKNQVMCRLKEGVALIHIATHGNAAKLVLAPDPRIYQDRIPVEEDYMLTVNEIYSCKINAQLVVLSCCHSGRGEVRAEGVVGLARAFLVAGARSVLASLWQISDEAALHFMMSFYEHLSSGKSACSSLQEAMMDMRENPGKPEWSHPYYWGSFFIVGHDVTFKVDETGIIGTVE